MKKYFVHESAYIDEDVEIGDGTKIWHFCHILKGTKIGKKCSFGQNIVIGPDVEIGNNCKFQANAGPIPPRVIFDDFVFCGPHVVFTNIRNPRSHWPRRDKFQKTIIKKGVTLGGNSTLICGITLGKYSFVAAGSVVTKDVPDYALVCGTPARINGWICYCGEKLNFENDEAKCKLCNREYAKHENVIKMTKDGIYKN